jgi:hypothetical protein
VPSLQVLPFEFDAWNETGRYRSMIDSCAGEDGKPRCFYRDFDELPLRLLPADEAEYQRLLQVS